MSITHQLSIRGLRTKNPEAGLISHKDKCVYIGGWSMSGVACPLQACGQAEEARRRQRFSVCRQWCAPGNDLASLMYCVAGDKPCIDRYAR
ncbi:hypothetical protein ALP50_03289 [Pseudomonas syringae pv. spinaceae]|nr:hypothetical protein ALP50_03289 [Pseudomonas syringae pv. spinaceae]